MSGSVNKVVLLGRLGKDPEVRRTGDGKAVASLTVATGETWKDKATGERKERTEWHRVVVFGGVAEIAEKYLKKGDQAYFEGKLNTRKWQDKDGQDRYTTEIVVDLTGTLCLLGGGQKEPSCPSAAALNPAQQQQSAPAQPFDDDIPF